MNRHIKLVLIIGMALFFAGCTTSELTDNPEPATQNATTNTTTVGTVPDWKGSEVTITAEELIDAGLDFRSSVLDTS